MPQIALRRNRQKMSYALPLEKVPIYERDQDGNILYEGYEDIDGTFVYIYDSEGNKIPKDTGENKTVFSEPVGFKGYVGSQLEDAITRAWGSDNSNNFAVLVISKNAIDENGNDLDFPKGTLIWRKYKPEIGIDGTIEPGSADYIVDGVLDEELNETSYYLRKQR